MTATDNRNSFLRRCLLFLWIIALPACADYRLHAPAAPVAGPAPSEAPVHTLYLIGDTAPPEGTGPSPAMQLLGSHLADASKETTLVFLGNTLYPNGMAPEEAVEERTADEAMLRAQLELIKDFPGQLFFVAGDYDWADYGVDGLQRQRDFIEDYLDRDDLWEPTCGCGDPKEVDLTDELVLLLLDSQWWLTDWRGEPEVNKRCEAKSRDYFKLLYADAVKGNREKNIVVAMHHPVFSKGPHGGAFTARQHLFPLTDINKKLWLPLPGIGSLYPFYRASVGAPQDLASPAYQELRNYLLDVARINGRFIFAAGHENSLQYLEKDNQHIVVSGAGASRTAARMTEGVRFAYGHQGFAQLDFYTDGAVWLRFWAVGENTPVYQQQIKGALATPAPRPDTAYSQLPRAERTTPAPMVEEVPQRHGIGRWLWGAHYRDTYAQVLEYPELDLSRFQGGVEPVKMGGGYQTNSLRLQAADERQYTMRSIEKDPTRTVPYPMNRSRFVLDIVKDAFTASHPMSALPIPRLADAVGVYHTNPTVYYVPRQPALGRYNEDFGDALYLVEERPDDKVWSDQASFGRPYDIESTTDVVEKITDEQDHRIDLEAVVRARTFDLFLGDWDRHDDQWRWAQFDYDSVDIYRPIPRDRDQAFCKYDGFLYSIVNKSIPPARPMRPYRPYQKKIQWSNFGPRHFDATFLGGASWELWEQAVRHIQENLPDSLIEAAFREAWPGPVYELDGAETVRIAQQRRDNLLRMAREFYEFRARKVDVLGTNEEDIFEVMRAADGATTVTVYATTKKGKRQAPFFRRTFLPDETKEITLYGLRDDDVFHLRGTASRGPLIRIVGGLGEETVTDESNVSGLARKTVVYDAREEDIELNTGGETRIRLKKDPRYNTYNRRAHDYDFNYSRIVPSARYNPDDGVLLRLSPVWYTYGFKKAPYASEQSVMLKYATANSGFEISYRGTFIDVIGKQDLLIDGIWRNPLYAYNFYGLGNETENPEDELGPDYNRVRQRYIAVAPSIQHRLRGAARYSFGPTFESHQIDTIGGRFIDEIAPSLNQEMFRGLEFLGAYFRFRVENLNDPLFPTHGLQLSLTAGWKWSLDEKANNFPYFQGQAAIYQQIDGGGRLVFASRVGGMHLFNNKFEFFQGARLGGSGPDRNFRGFRRDRFTGRSSFFHNNDLRWKAIQSENRVLPFSLGFLTGFDYGRVWVDGEDSDRWHYSYGAGFWFSPFNLVDLRFDWFRGDNVRNQFNFSGRFFF